ncbi:YciI family protein [Solicola gregarius]|uniref:YciI family protein n=1 Tax=Solicola gregarius TaxID=2908642 RepID=A0AA46YMY7_9ACTN|nr:YciI family protein [Solicola gregarius]UYM07079.1 YciI family protein [Solicola gregarius]
MPRFLTIVHHDEQNLPTGDPSPELQKQMGELFEEISKAGVMLDMAELTLTSESTRISGAGGKVTHIDGPFAESKEVVGGYTIVQTKTRAEAVEWARRFIEIQSQHDPCTAEVREIKEG